MYRRRLGEVRSLAVAFIRLFISSLAAAAAAAELGKKVEPLAALGGATPGGKLFWAPVFNAPACASVCLRARVCVRRCEATRGLANGKLESWEHSLKERVCFSGAHFVQWNAASSCSFAAPT